MRAVGQHVVMKVDSGFDRNTPTLTSNDKAADCLPLFAQ